jgi:methyl-accepting chemotaxis protein
MKDKIKGLTSYMNEVVAVIAALLLVIVELLYPGNHISIAIVVFLVFLAWKNVKTTRGVAKLQEAIRSALAKKEPASTRAPTSLSGLLRDIEELSAAYREADMRDGKHVAELKKLMASTDDVAANLSAGVAEQREVTGDVTTAIKELSEALGDLASHVETLATAAEESSASILEMTATNEEVAENIRSSR